MIGTSGERVARCTPTAAARTAAEALRTLNHLSGAASTGSGLRCAGDVYDVLAGLAALADRLPQALCQLAAYLSREYDTGRLVLSPASGPDPDDAVWTELARVTAGLAAGAEQADRLAWLLHRSWSATARFASVPPDLAEDRDGDRADDDSGTHR